MNKYLNNVEVTLYDYVKYVEIEENLTNGGNNIQSIEDVIDILNITIPDRLNGDTIYLSKKLSIDIWGIIENSIIDGEILNVDEKYLYKYLTMLNDVWDFDFYDKLIEYLTGKGRTYNTEEYITNFIGNSGNIRIHLALKGFLKELYIDNILDEKIGYGLETDFNEEYLINSMVYRTEIYREMEKGSVSFLDMEYYNIEFIGNDYKIIEYLVENKNRMLSQIVTCGVLDDVSPVIKGLYMRAFRELPGVPKVYIGGPRFPQPPMGIDYNMGHHLKDRAVINPVALAGFYVEDLHHNLSITLLDKGTREFTPSPGLETEFSFFERRGDGVIKSVTTCLAVIFTEEELKLFLDDMEDGKTDKYEIIDKYKYLTEDMMDDTDKLIRKFGINTVLRASNSMREIIIRERLNTIGMGGNKIKGF